MGARLSIGDQEGGHQDPAGGQYGTSADHLSGANEGDRSPSLGPVRSSAAGSTLQEAFWSSNEAVATKEISEAFHVPLAVEKVSQVLLEVKERYFSVVATCIITLDTK